MLKKYGLFILSFLVFSLSANAIELHFNGFIADEANLLPKEVKQDLNMTLLDLQKKSGADIAVVTLPTLNGKTVEEVALDIGRSYKLGAVGKNNGMVFLTSLAERRMRIELGLGLEDKISISTLETIRDNDIIPYYKKSDYANGITRGTYVLAQTVAQAEGVKLNIQGKCPPALGASSSQNSSSEEKIPWWAYPFVLIAALFRGRRRSGSFGGFGGGGGFGGSGCSGSW